MPRYSSSHSKSHGFQDFYTKDRVFWILKFKYPQAGHPIQVESCSFLYPQDFWKVEASSGETRENAIQNAY